MNDIQLGYDGMTLEDLVEIAREDAKVSITDNAKERIVRSRELIAKWVQEERVR